MISRALAAVALFWALGFAWFAVALPEAAGPERTDAIVVLTGGAGRIDRALTLLDAGRAGRLLVSGADRIVKPHELALEYHAPTALFDCCVDLGHEAVDTRSNAEETARWAARRHYSSLRLVTSDWHMRRARFELRRALDPKVTLIGDAVRTNPGFAMLVAEYDKYLLRRAAVLVGI